MFLERSESATRQGLQSTLPWRYVLYIVWSFECGQQHVIPCTHLGIVNCEPRASHLFSKRTDFSLGRRWYLNIIPNKISQRFIRQKSLHYFKSFKPRKSDRPPLVPKEEPICIPVRASTIKQYTWGFSLTNSFTTGEQPSFGAQSLLVVVGILKERRDLTDIILIVESLSVLFGLMSVTAAPDVGMASKGSG